MARTDLWRVVYTTQESIGDSGGVEELEQDLTMNRAQKIANTKTGTYIPFRNSI